MHKFRRAAECFVASVALVSLTVISDRLHFNLTSVGLLFVIVVVLISRIGSFVSSIFVSIVAALCLAYVAPPAHSFRIDDPLDYVAIAAFLIVSLTISELVSKARMHAKQEIQLLRQEIAHVGRVSMMGQLASALAHEITQPLSAILRNTEAAELFMQNTSPDLDEIRAILADIREDDQRAGRVIDRMGRLLKAHILETRPLGVGELVCDVAALVRIDALARHVELKVEVPGDLPPVLGDRVHLQQVLLNLILNAMDAVNGASGQVRRVNITAQLEGAQSVEIVVSDTGHGIPADKLAHIFDPFFTTKAKGMGMGLPISRTIIEEHGGQIRAENMNDGGASFRFTLPIAEKAAE
jgi:C4-dicarboxylate-specific signal transduction histidine kinase